MSAIVGLETSEGTWLAADSAISNEEEIASFSGKLFFTGEVGVGGAGDVRTIQIVKYMNIVPPDKSESDLSQLEGWLVSVFIPTLRKLLLEEERWTAESLQLLSSFLLVVNGRLFVFQGWAVWHPLEGYASVGSGGYFSMGSLCSTSKGKNPEQRVIRAVEAAIEHSPSCKGPVYTMFCPR